MRTGLVAALAFLVLAGCMRGGLNLTPGPIKLYEGQVQPPESLAIIENAGNMYLVSVDSQSLIRRAHAHDTLTVQVAPGRHVVVAQPSERAGLVSLQAARIEFVAHAGHRYVVSRRVIGNSADRKWEAVFVDVTTGKELLP